MSLSQVARSQRLDFFLVAIVLLCRHRSSLPGRYRTRQSTLFSSYSKFSHLNMSGSKTAKEIRTEKPYFPNLPKSQPAPQIDPALAAPKKKPATSGASSKSSQAETASPSTNVEAPPSGPIKPGGKLSNQLEPSDPEHNGEPIVTGSDSADRRFTMRNPYAPDFVPPPYYDYEDDNQDIG